VSGRGSRDLSRDWRVPKNSTRASVIRIPDPGRLPVRRHDAVLLCISLRTLPRGGSAGGGASFVNVAWYGSIEIARRGNGTPPPPPPPHPPSRPGQPGGSHQRTARRRMAAAKISVTQTQSIIIGSGTTDPVARRPGRVSISSSRLPHGSPRSCEERELFHKVVGQPTVQRFNETVPPLPSELRPFGGASKAVDVLLTQGHVDPERVVVEAKAQSATVGLQRHGRMARSRNARSKLLVKRGGMTARRRQPGWESHCDAELLWFAASARISPELPPYV